jgi:alkaline phosphatase
MSRLKKIFASQVIFIGFILYFAALSFAGQAKNIIFMIGDGIGPGPEKIKGWRHNTELFTIMKEAYGF